MESVNWLNRFQLSRSEQNSRFSTEWFRTPSLSRSSLRPEQPRIIIPQISHVLFNSCWGGPPDHCPTFTLVHVSAHILRSLQDRRWFLACIRAWGNYSHSLTGHSDSTLPPRPLSLPPPCERLTRVTCLAHSSYAVWLGGWTFSTICS